MTRSYTLTFAVLLLFFLSLLPVFSLLQPGLPITHDGQDHVVRIANFFASLEEGIVIPRWGANLNWGYGHPVLMFLYPLPSYIVSVFHFAGFGLVDATKLVFALSYVVSVIAMFIWANSRWGVYSGFTAAILYGFAPYRFVDLYIRGALGEHVAFAFLPLVLWGLDKLVDLDKKRFFWSTVVSLSTAGLVLSHNAVSLMFFPLIILYGAYIYSQKRHTMTFVYWFIWSIAVGMALSAFFWIPAFFEGKYTLRDIVTKGEFLDRFVPPAWFVYSPWNYGGGSQFTKQLGTASWPVILLGIYMFRQYKKLIGGILVLIAVALFLMTEWSLPVWKTVTILQKFQFPWRLLTITTFLISFMGAACAKLLSIRGARVFTFLVTFLAIGTTFFMWKPSGYQQKPETFYTDVYTGTTDTGESSPIWSVRFMEYTASAPSEVIEGNAQIIPRIRTTTKRVYDVYAQERSRIAENTLYFPGWVVMVDGKPTNVEFQDPSWRGLMTYWVDAGRHEVEIVFGDTKLRTFSNKITLIGIIALFITYAQIYFRSHIG